MTVKPRPFAVFDLDGTLIRWQLYHALADQLVKQGDLDATQYQAVRAARMTWKKRASENSFREYEDALVKLVYATMNDIPVANFEQAGAAVIAEYRDQVYTYTRDLIKSLRVQDYLLFAVSASPESIVAIIADYYSFDGYAGSSYDSQDGHFTGEMDVVLRTRKPDKIRELMSVHHAVLANSIAVGDSEGDIPMLEMVEQPIAFNPTKELFEHARAAGWQIVVERKNVVYELEPDDGSYLLA